MNLNEQMIRLANGEMDAFDVIYRETKGAVYHVALSVVREHSLAEDVMQNCFLNVIRCAGQYRAGTNAKAWIAKIARNEALNVVRKYKREQLVDHAETPEIFGTHEHDYGHVTDLMQKCLTEEEFTIVMLAAADGYKRREIAEIFAMPLATVTWKYHKAIQKLQKALKEEGR